MAIWILLGLTGAFTRLADDLRAFGAGEAVLLGVRSAFAPGWLSSLSAGHGLFPASLPGESFRNETR